MKGFVAYSKADSTAVNRLLVHLKGLISDELIETWYDQQLVPGDDWDANIQAKLSAAEVVIFCVSADLLATDYVREKEIPIAISRHNRDEATVIPVILRRCASESNELARLQGIPAEGSVQGYVHHGKERKAMHEEKTWTEVTRAVREAVLLRQNRGRMDTASQAKDYVPLPSEQTLIEQLHGAVPEPFPPLDDWNHFCHIALSVLTLKFVVDRLYEHGDGVFESNLRAPLGQNPVDNCDPGSFDIDVEEQDVSDTFARWRLEGHDLGVQLPGSDSWIPTHPSLVYGTSGLWRGWNDFLGQNLGDDSYNENLCTDVIEEKAFERYIAMARRVLHLVKQGRQTWDWSELKMFDFLKRQIKYWVWDPRHREQDHPLFS